jgi:hypothetical protein
VGEPLGHAAVVGKLTAYAKATPRGPPTMGTTLNPASMALSVTSRLVLLEGGFSMSTTVRTCARHSLRRVVKAGPAARAVVASDVCNQVGEGPRLYIRDAYTSHI